MNSQDEYREFLNLGAGCYKTQDVLTCYHDLQLSQGRVCRVGEEDVYVSNHRFLLLFTWFRKALLVQDDKRALW